MPTSPVANWSRLVLPSQSAPASSSFCTAVAWRGGTKVKAGQAAVVGTPDKLDWSAFTYTGLDIDAELTALNTTFAGQALTADVDLAVSGGVALNVLGGILVAKGDFDIALGQVKSAALNSGAGQDAGRRIQDSDF